MRFVISSGDMKSAVSEVAKVIASKNVLPILDCIRIEARGTDVTFTAADQEMAMTVARKAASVEEEGAACIIGKTLQSAVSTLAEQPVEMIVNDKTATFNYLKGHFSVPVSDPNDWPNAQAVDGDDVHELTMLAKTMTEAMSRASACVKVDDLRPTMSGVCFDVTDGRVDFVGSDGNALADIAVEHYGIRGPWSLILPLKAVGLLTGTKTAESEGLTIRADGKRFCAKYSVSGKVLTGRCIEGRYPRWQSVIPSKFAGDANIALPDLLAAIRRVSVFAQEKGSVIKLDLNRGGLTVSAKNIDFNTAAEETIPCTSTEYMAIGFAPDKLLNTLSAAGAGDGIVMRYNAPDKAAVVVPAEQPESMTTLGLVMPMMIG